jgi:hypothetical protein
LGISEPSVKGFFAARLAAWLLAELPARVARLAVNHAWRWHEVRIAWRRLVRAKVVTVARGVELAYPLCGLYADRRGSSERRGESTLLAGLAGTLPSVCTFTLHRPTPSASAWSGRTHKGQPGGFSCLLNNT